MKPVLTALMVIVMATQVSGCDKSKQEVDDATAKCISLGGKAVYYFSNSKPQTIYRISCEVKSPDGQTYTVRPNGRGLNQ